MRYGYLLWIVALAAAMPLTLNNVDSNPYLRFGSNGKFSITVSNDLHLGEKDNAEGDHKIIGVTNSILDYKYSDMVVLNDDLITCDGLTTEHAIPLIDQITKPLIDRNTPFAATFGNHDMSPGCSTRAMSEHMWSIQGNNGKRLSFTTSSVEGSYNEVGTSNYYLPIHSSDGSRLVLMLYFFDSKGGTDVLDSVDDKVTAWFRCLQTAVKFFGHIPSLALVHIPIYATWAMQDKLLIDVSTSPGLNRELINHQGNQRHTCDKDGKNCKYAGLDKPFMEELVKTEGLMAVFFGHNHRVDFCAKWSMDLANNEPMNGNGLNICFNRKSGYGGYSGWTHGGFQQIVIDESRLPNKDIDTWIRLEDGNISGSITLNSTCGTDCYPPVAIV